MKSVTVLAALAYCPTCREHFEVEENPPYAVIHLGDGTHLHPITRERVE